jgi:hypothetical protein
MRLQNDAENILDGRPVYDRDEAIQQITGIRPDAVGRTASSLFAQAIVATPQAVHPITGRMQQLPVWSAGTVTGPDHRGTRPGQILTVGDEGVTLTVGAGQQVTVRYADTAALLRWTDQKLALIGSDGFRILLDPTDWPGARAVLDSIAASVSPNLVIDMEGSGPAGTAAPGATATPAHSQPPVAPQGPIQPQPAVRPQRPVRAPRPPRTAGERVALVWSVTLWILLGTCTLIGAIDVASGPPRAWPFLVIGVAGAAWRAVPLIYHQLHPGRPQQSHHWGFRILRGFLVTLTVILLISLSAGDTPGWWLAAAAVTVLALRALIATYLHRRAASGSGDISAGPAG